jgi:NAD(P)-dependent dehydrogenase (short-subunit alcohol dehydrogenase family)
VTDLPEGLHTATSLSGLLTDRVAVVTGAGRGNGRAIAIGLAAAGAAVAVTDIDPESATATAEHILRTGGRAVALRWDITDADAARAAAERIHAQLGTVSILINNAGIEGGGQAGEPGFLEGLQRVFDVNMTGTACVTDALMADLKTSRGCIVNITSMMAHVAYQPGAGVYAAAKAALTQWTRSLAIDLAPHGIRVNAVAPGFFLTAMTEGTRRDPARMAYFESRTPMKRMGDPTELVGPVVFLASGLASYVTGAVLPVDGGLLAR